VNSKAAEYHAQRISNRAGVIPAQEGILGEDLRKAVAIEVYDGCHGHLKFEAQFCLLKEREEAEILQFASQLIESASPPNYCCIDRVHVWDTQMDRVRGFL
jgi:hypothetical protein